ncbi:MAG: hypothetical protein KDH20_08560 [Rhodocyclaceae bacterium]|nr:hypothetical protein [Rhodocyclaceae bacterium]
MNLSFTRRADPSIESGSRLARAILEMSWNDDRFVDRSDMDDEVVRMIQLNGMIGTDPELAEVY